LYGLRQRLSAHHWGDDMKIKPNERQEITDMLREELEQANRRILDRFSRFERQTSTREDAFKGVRRLYEDLSDNNWTDADEQALGNLADSNEEEIKRMMREGFRRTRVHPAPNFASLIIALKKNPGEPLGASDTNHFNPDAVPSAERERIANVLHRELSVAVEEIAARLRLPEARAEIVREQLEIAEGAIISSFTPLV
jgi:hypothetical protein